MKIKAAAIVENILDELGPLAPLAGIWEGDKGLDYAPSKQGPKETPFRERLTLEPVGPVDNRKQILYGLKYTTTAWPLGENEAFHEEVGYWLWDAERELVMRSFIVPRGVLVNAGGKATATNREFEMSAEVGSEVFGVLSNPFLDEAFKTVRYHVKVSIHDNGSFSYHEDTQLKIAGQSKLFHHTDQNTLTRIS